jgi:glyoxylase-like metal-dependent hydrolase (beta-lactamase superfamily II)
VLRNVHHLFVTHCHIDHAGGSHPRPTALATHPDAFLAVHAVPGTLEALWELLAPTAPSVESWRGDSLRWCGPNVGEQVRAGVPKLACSK